MTRSADALASARIGADFIGLILHAKSPRTISVGLAAAIVRELPASTIPVGVFVNAVPMRVQEVCQYTGIQHVQLHGDETPEMVDALRPLRAWKMLRVDESLADRISIWRRTGIEAVVLEPTGTGAAGGSGRPNDWSAVAAIRDALATPDPPHLIAAGGLNPENVAEVVRLVRPWAVDVSSGVEGSQKGLKSHEKLASFVSAVAQAWERKT